MTELPPNARPIIQAKSEPKTVDATLAGKASEIIIKNFERTLTRNLENEDLKEILNPVVVQAGLKNALKQVDWWDHFSSQPMTAPIGLAFYMERRMNSSDVNEYGQSVPTVYLNISSDSVASTSRTTKARIKKDANQHQVSRAFVQALDEIRKEAYGDMLNAALAGEVDQVSEELSWMELSRTANKIYKQTMRGPANHVLCHPKHEKVLKLHSNRLEVVTDYEFPEDKR